MSNEVIQKRSIADYLSAPMVRQQINNVVGKTNSTRFISSIISAVQTNPALAGCTQKSILNSALLGETLNLSPSPQLGQYYMVPYLNKGVYEAQYQIGYRGFLQLAIRSGEYKRLNVLPIKEGELVRWNPLDEEITVQMIEDEGKRAKAKTIGYYGMFELTNGFRKAIYWSYEKMLLHAETYSKGFAAKKGYTFWEKDFDAMACKTIIRQLISKWGVMSIEMQRAYKADMGVITSDITDTSSDFNVEYIDNPQAEEKVEKEVVEEAKPFTPATETQLNIIRKEVGDTKNLLKFYKVSKLEDLSVEQASEIITSFRNGK